MIFRKVDNTIVGLIFILGIISSPSLFALGVPTFSEASCEEAKIPNQTINDVSEIILNVSPYKNSRSYPDFQVPPINTSELDSRWKKEVERLLDEVPLKNLEVVAPDYQEAAHLFRQNIAQSFNAYFEFLNRIRLNTEKAMTPGISALKALSEGSSGDNSRIIGLGISPARERIRQQLEKVSAENQKLYSEAQLSLLSPVQIHSSEDEKNEFREELYQLETRFNKEYNVDEIENSLKRQFQYLWKNSNLSLDFLEYRSPYICFQIAYSDSGGSGTASRAGLGCEKVSANLHSFLTQELRSTPIKNFTEMLSEFRNKVQKEKVRRFKEEKEKLLNQLRVEKGIDNQAIKKCKSYVCAKLLESDYKAFRVYVDRFFRNVSFDNISNQLDSVQDKAELNSHYPSVWKKMQEQHIVDSHWLKPLENKQVKSDNWFLRPLHQIESKIDQFSEKLPSALFKEKDKKCAAISNHSEKKLKVVSKSKKESTSYDFWSDRGE